MRVGLTYDLKSDLPAEPGAPDDAGEEFDSETTVDALAREMEGLGHQVVRLGGGAKFLKSIPCADVDFVFNIAEGRGVYRSRESQVPAVLEMLGIPYSGSDPLTLALSLDKPMAKQFAQWAGVAIPEHWVVESLEALERLRDRSIQYPVMVKPAFEGSSKGIRATSRVDDWHGLAEAVNSSLDSYHQPVLVERFIGGREITVGIIGNDPLRLVGIMEVVPRHGPDPGFMYSLEVKRNWEDMVSYQCPPDAPQSCIRQIEESARAVFRAMGCRDVARLDFRVDQDFRPYFIEINPLPGLSPTLSDLPILAGLCGWSYTRLIEQILSSALERCRSSGRHGAHLHHIQ